MLAIFITDAISLDKLLALPYALIVLALFLWVFLKGLPTWKEVKLSENESRKADAAAIGALANSIIALSGSQSQFSNVVNNLAIEQKRQLDQIRIMQRVSVSSNDDVIASVQNFTEQVQFLNERVEQLERQKDETRST